MLFMVLVSMIPVIARRQVGQSYDYLVLDRISQHDFASTLSIMLPQCTTS